MSLHAVTPGSRAPDEFKVVNEIPMAADPIKYEIDRLGREYETSTDVDIVVHGMGARLLLGILEALPRPTAGQGPAVKFRQFLMVAPRRRNEPPA